MKKRIEVVEPGGFMDGAIRRENGDIFTTDQADYFISLGWAKDVESGEVGERVLGPSSIRPDNVETKIA